MKKSDSRPPCGDRPFIRWASIVPAVLLLSASPGMTRESARPARAAAASVTTARPEDTNVRVLERIRYGLEAPQAQMLNVYLVRRDTPTAAIIQILSGGWNSAPPQRANIEPFRAYFDAGISVIVVAHRPIGKDIHWPAPGDDIARAIQFVRAHAGDWGIDPNRIAVKGRSSGGHLALMAGFGPDRINRTSTDPVERQSSRPNCIVAGAAPTDLVLQMSELLKDSDRQAYLWERMTALVGGTPGETSRDELLAKLKPLSPTEYVTKDAPPVFLTHQGPADAFWPGDTRLKWDVHTPITGLILEKRLKELHVPYELVISPAGGRGDTTLLRRELAFLARHLHLPTGPQGSSHPPTAEAPRYQFGTKSEPPAGRMDKRAELAKFDEPAAHLPAKGPGGTAWDTQYRSLIQSDESAVSKGFPTHAEAVRQIEADAARNPASLQEHKGWVLFIKHYSQKYRPPEATEALRRLYQDLVEMEFGGSAARADLPFAGDSRLTICRDVVYGQTHPDIQRLDAYLVKSPRPTAVLIEIHGGGWRRGEKSQFTYRGDLIKAVLAAGISVVSIDYRLTPEHTLPAQMEDAARAVQFVRSRAREWNIEPNRIAAMGGSAGAHLSAWVGLHDNLAQPDSPDPIGRLSSRLTCFVALSGPMDLLRVDLRTLAQAGARGESFADAFLAAVGATPEQFMTDPDIRRRLKEASPVFLVSPDDPPAMVVGAGPAEAARIPPTVPATINDPHSAWQSALLADALRRAGVDVVARLGPDVGKDPQADTAAIIAFLTRHLGTANP